MSYPQTTRHTSHKALYKGEQLLLLLSCSWGNFDAEGLSELPCSIEQISCTARK